MTNSIQSVAVADRTGHLSLPARNLQFSSSNNRQKTEKTENKFLTSSPFSGFYLFNMLIINRLNKQKQNTPF